LGERTRFTVLAYTGVRFGELAALRVRAGSTIFRALSLRTEFRRHDGKKIHFEFNDQQIDLEGLSEQQLADVLRSPSKLRPDTRTSAGGDRKIRPQVKVFTRHAASRWRFHRGTLWRHWQWQTKYDQDFPVDLIGVDIAWDDLNEPVQGPSVCRATVKVTRGRRPSVGA
jgi:hypothetical protein